MNATRFLGHCQICEGEFKLVPESSQVVHHGYRRPGHGHIVGDCMGVFELPYELSCEALKTYLTAVKARLQAKLEYLNGLNSGEVVKFYQESRITGGQHLVVKAYTSEYAWATALRGEVSRTEYEIRMAESEVKRVAQRISNWKLAPVKTWDEDVSEKAAEKAVRDAERAEKARVKAEKEAAKKAKREALAAKKLAEKERAVQKVKELAASTLPEAEKAAKVAKLLKQLRSKWYPRDLGCEAELDSLGMLRREDRWIGWAR